MNKCEYSFYTPQQNTVEIEMAVFFLGGEQRGTREKVEGMFHVNRDE